jgi:hypothetical protein
MISFLRPIEPADSGSTILNAMGSLCGIAPETTGGINPHRQYIGNFKKNLKSSSVLNGQSKPVEGPWQASV